MKTASLLTRERAAELLDSISAARVMLIGDFCLDAYWKCDMRLSELSRETPHFPLPVVSESYSAGGAGNVAANLAALQPAEIEILGAIGADWRGEMLKRALIQANVNPFGLIEAPDRITNAYIKPLRSGISSAVYEDPRIDFESRAPIPEWIEGQILARLDSFDFDALLVSDQMRFGIVTDRIRERICEIGEGGGRVIVDSRDRIGLYRNVIVKPNEIEAARAIRRSVQTAAEALECAEIAIQTLAERNAASAIVTLGEQGCLALSGPGEAIVHCPARRVEPPVDIVGAGDTFLSCFGLAIASGASVPEAAQLATIASSVTVKKIGATGTASRSEILAAL